MCPELPLEALPYHFVPELPSPLQREPQTLGKESRRLPGVARGREGVQYGDYYIQSLNHPKKVLSIIHFTEEETGVKVFPSWESWVPHLPGSPLLTPLLHHLHGLYQVMAVGGRGGGKQKRKGP